MVDTNRKQQLAIDCVMHFPNSVQTIFRFDTLKIMPCMMHSTLSIKLIPTGHSPSMGNDINLESRMKRGLESHFHTHIFKCWIVHFQQNVRINMNILSILVDGNLRRYALSMHVESTDKFELLPCSVANCLVAHENLNGRHVVWCWFQELCRSFVL